MIYYGCGLAVAAIIGIAAGTRFVERRGLAGFLIVAGLTGLLGVIIGLILTEVERRAEPDDQLVGSAAAEPAPRFRLSRITGRWNVGRSPTTS